MNKAKFYIEKRKDKLGNLITENVPIRMSFHFNGLRLEYYSRVRVNNASNFNSEYPKEGKGYIKPQEPEAGRKNKQLKDLANKSELIYDNAIALQMTPTPLYIKLKLDQHFKSKTIETCQTLVKDAFLEFLDYAKQKRSLATWKRYNTTFNHLQNVFKNNFKTLLFTQIDSTFIEKFRIGLGSSGYTLCGLKTEYHHNTIVKYLRSMREFLNWCKDEKRQYYDGNLKFDEMKENEANIIFLNERQILLLEKAVMPNKKLQQVKDVFLFGIYTGMRYGDIYNLKKVNVFDDLIRFYIIKNKKTVWHEIPLINSSCEIIKRVY